MRPGRRLALLFVVWSVPGLVSAIQLYVHEAGQGGPTLIRALVWQLASWWAWIPLTPLVVHLAERFPLERGRLGLSVPAHGVAAFAFAVPHLLASALAGRLAGIDYYLATPIGELVARLYARHVHLDVITYLAVLAAATAAAAQGRLRARELVAAQLEARAAEAELRALEMQLQPHFLFNTLNAIAALVRKADGARALATITALAEFLRLTLSERGRATVPLEREIGLTRRYLELEQTRVGDARLAIEVDAPGDVLAAQVPTLVLQPLVENAVRHGVGPRPAGGRVTVTAARRGARLHLEVADDGVGLPAGFSLAHTGIGLGNIRDRLAQLYPGDHRFELAARPGGGALATIDLPLAAPQEPS